MSDLSRRYIQLAEFCNICFPDPAHDALISGVMEILPEFDFHHVLTRSGWHRIGGVVTGDYQKIAPNLRQWAESESDHDMFVLYEKYGADGYLTTRFDGRTHYFVAQTGKRSPDFVQLEVEELVEVVDHPLFIDDQIPDDIEELLDSSGASQAQLEPRALSQPRYMFRELTDIDELVADQAMSAGSDLRYIRFLEEWDRSSAGLKARFSDHFALRMLPFIDRFGERKIEATPLPADRLEIPTRDFSALSGRVLSDFLQNFDRNAGFPMAWYFTMLIEKKAMTSLAQAVYLDHQRNYRYLPERDLAVLEGWMSKPYSF